MMMSEHWLSFSKENLTKELSEILLLLAGLRVCIARANFHPRRFLSLFVEHNSQRNFLLSMDHFLSFAAASLFLDLPPYSLLPPPFHPTAHLHLNCSCKLFFLPHLRHKNHFTKCLIKDNRKTTHTDWSVEIFSPSSNLLSGLSVFVYEWKNLSLW